MDQPHRVLTVSGASRIHMIGVSTAPNSCRLHRRCLCHHNWLCRSGQSIKSVQRLTLGSSNHFYHAILCNSRLRAKHRYAVTKSTLRWNCMGCRHYTLCRSPVDTKASLLVGISILSNQRNTYHWKLYNERPAPLSWLPGTAAIHQWALSCPDAFN